ncbi:ABC transporter ATP-binding protein [Aeromicrobium sp.]|uniref:ABC transporter ATP-binding protein n=1 Tax=Aeromicrobium sp. TaxID=1871063 RepID=UPI0025C0D7A2|nr:ABC transporter ATP-binding protein [Aeromicrobium sp.]MCK5892576.1 ABC transporter ATP-binding protein [Aeromicrobium sp.]
MSQVLLEATDVAKHFGAVHAVDSVSWSLSANEICGVTGPNGSGKTSLFNCLSGFYPITSGSIRWHGEDISRTSMRQRSRRGLVRTFQDAEVFGSLSVRDNVEVAREQARRGARASELRSADDLLDVVGLAGQGHRTAGALSYGNRRLLGVAMALATAPQAVLLDEPTSGLNEMESAEVQRRLRVLPEVGIAVGIIDHHMDFLLPLCDRVIVLQSGSLLWERPPEAFESSEVVMDAYLGRAAR